MIEKESAITIKVGLDENKVPAKIQWQASDMNMEDFKDVKAFFLTLLEKDTLDTLKIDLWTKELQIGEMDTFVFQSLRSITDAYQRATSNNELANEMMRFVHYFGEKTGIIPPEES